MVLCKIVTKSGLHCTLYEVYPCTFLVQPIGFLVCLGGGNKTIWKKWYVCYVLFWSVIFNSRSYNDFFNPEYVISKGLIEFSTVLRLNLFGLSETLTLDFWARALLLGLLPDPVLYLSILWIDDSFYNELIQQLEISWTHLKIHIRFQKQERLVHQIKPWFPLPQHKK